MHYHHHQHIAPNVSRSVCTHSDHLSQQPTSSSFQLSFCYVQLKIAMHHLQPVPHSIAARCCNTASTVDDILHQGMTANAQHLQQPMHNLIQVLQNWSLHHDHMYNHAYKPHISSARWHPNCRRHTDWGLWMLCHKHIRLELLAWHKTPCKPVHLCIEGILWSKVWTHSEFCNLMGNTQVCESVCITVVRNRGTPHAHTMHVLQAQIQHLPQQQLNSLTLTLLMTYQVNPALLQEMATTQHPSITGFSWCYSRVK